MQIDNSAVHGIKTPKWHHDEYISYLKALSSKATFE